MKPKRAKRGQITVFIILGIVILVVIGALLYIRSSAPKEEGKEELIIDTSSLKAFIGSCAKSTAQDALVYVGLRGGNVFSSNYTTFLSINVPYYYYEGKDLSPDNKTIRDSLKFYMDNALKTCTNSFQTFKEQGYAIEEGDVNSNVTIADEEVIFDIEYPVTIVKGDAKETIQRSRAEVKVNLMKIVEASRECIEAQKNEPNAFRLKHMIDIVSANDLKFEVFDRGQGIVVISLVDESVEINKNPYVFTFAIKYKWS